MYTVGANFKITEAGQIVFIEHNKFDDGLFSYVYSHVLPRKEAKESFEKVQNCRVSNPLARRENKGVFNL